jgi:hypothetical protein
MQTRTGVSMLALVGVLGGAACADEEGGPGGSRDMGQTGTGGSAGTTGSGAQPNVDEAVLECGDAQLIIEDYFAHDLAADSQNYYWLGTSDAGIGVWKLSKSGGDKSLVTEFPGYFSVLFGETDLPVAADSQLYMDDTVADDADDYVYFSGDTQIWRVKKDGSEPVQAVSGPGLNELGPATCNFARSVLTPDAVFTCRQGRVFRMARAGDGSATAVYSAPEGGSISAFAVHGNQLFVNGAYDDARHLAPILSLPATGGTPAEYGAMLEGLYPDALMMQGDTLIFSSLFLADGPDLETESEWASRQGTYKLSGADATPVKLSENDLQLVRGVGRDSKYVYAMVGDQKIVRISLDGVTQTFVDCRGSASDLRFQELLVDDDGVYIRDEDFFYRFSE